METKTRLSIETEQEEDGRWIADAIDYPGVLAYGDTQAESVANIDALLFRVLKDRADHGEGPPEGEHGIPRLS